MTSNQASGKTTARQIRIVGVVVFGAFLALLNQTVMSPALPAIMADFGIDASTAQWIMSIYPLVSGIMVPVSAFLIDRFSTRALFFAATATFAAGTALHSWQAVAQGRSTIAHKGMLYAARIMALTAIDFLQKPELVNKAREELTETLNGETYPNPLPKDLKPEIW